MLKQVKHFVRRKRMARHGILPVLESEKLTLGTDGSEWTFCPDKLDQNSIVYSFGVGKNLSFDLELISRFGLTVHAFDPTPRARSWIETMDLPDQLIFHDYGVAGHDGTIAFFPPRKTTSVNFTPVRRYNKAAETESVACPVYSMSTIMKRLGHNHIDLLKMDIEGGEYAVLDDLIRRELVVGQLLVEFHHCYQTISYEESRQMINRLKEHSFKVLHVSERSYELSFLHQG